MATLNLMAPPGPGGPPPTYTGGSLDLTQTNCEMVQCGAIPQSVVAAAMATPPGLPPMNFQGACSAAGYAGPQGGRYWNDPVCSPWGTNILESGPSGQALEECVALGGQYNADGSCTTMPSATQSTMPSITDTANTVIPSTPQPILTPQYLVQKMPTIVNPAPMVSVSACSADPITQWVSDNPFIAALGLAAAAYMVWGKGR
jgi:hypothetical protein